MSIGTNMYTVHKILLRPESSQTITVPFNAQILSVHNQREAIALWVWCSVTEVRKSSRQIIIAFTGQFAPAPEGVRFIGTVLLDDGQYVCHVFERKLTEGEPDGTS